MGPLHCRSNMDYHSGERSKQAQPYNERQPFWKKQQHGCHHVWIWVWKSSSGNVMPVFSRQSRGKIGRRMPTQAYSASPIPSYSLPRSTDRRGEWWSKSCHGWSTDAESPTTSFRNLCAAIWQAPLCQRRALRLIHELPCRRDCANRTHSKSAMRQKTSSVFRSRIKTAENTLKASFRKWRTVVRLERSTVTIRNNWNWKDPRGKLVKLRSHNKLFD